ncbi:MAG: hypothetical protein Q9191_002146 [Dirinaria sp. TL-2023a]
MIVAPIASPPAADGDPFVSSIRSDRTMIHALAGIVMFSVTRCIVLALLFDFGQLARTELVVVLLPLPILLERRRLLGKVFVITSAPRGCPFSAARGPGARLVDMARMPVPGQATVVIRRMLQPLCGRTVDPLGQMMDTIVGMCLRECCLIFCFRKWDQGTMTVPVVSTSCNYSSNSGCGVRCFDFSPDKVAGIAGTHRP